MEDHITEKQLRALKLLAEGLKPTKALTKSKKTTTKNTTANAKTDELKPKVKSPKPEKQPPTPGTEEDIPQSTADVKKLAALTSKKQTTVNAKTAKPKPKVKSPKPEKQQPTPGTEEDTSSSTADAKKLALKPEKQTTKAAKVSTEVNRSITTPTNRKPDITPAIKVATKPRLTINKLAEYLIADPHKRKQIVQSSKYQRPFKARIYNYARESIKAYILDNNNKEFIADRIKTLTTKQTEFPHEGNDIENTILLFKRLLEIELPTLKEYRVEPFKDENKWMNIEGLNIGIYPDLIIDGENGKKGIIKIHLVKRSNLGINGSKYAAALLKHFLMKSGVSQNNTDDKLCVFIDVFKSSFMISPYAYQRTISKIEAACREFVGEWESI